MQQPQSSGFDRFRPVLYAFVAGLVIGMFIGWFFHGLVGTLVRIVIVLLILVPFVAAILFWWSVKNRPARPAPSSDIETTWREVDSSRSDRRS
jgi:F0F1-type ATP synthase assembly protein I